MGKKRNRDDDVNGKKKAEWWCYYCEAEARDETALIMHQRAKHFRCPYCEPGYPGGHCHGVGGLFSHVRRSHNKELLVVPGAMKGREDTNVEVEGMSGIPEHMLDGDGEATTQKDEAPAPPPWGYTSSAPPMVYIKKKEETVKPKAKAAPPTAEANITQMISSLLASANPAHKGLASALAQMQEGAMNPMLAATLLSAGPEANTATNLGLATTLASMAPGMGETAMPAMAGPMRPPSAMREGSFLSLIERTCGHWEDSNGKLIVIKTDPNCTVSVKHETRGDQNVKFQEFCKHGRILYAGREGSLEGNTLEWDNGAVWAKVCQEF